MTTRKIELEDLTKLTRKEMAHQILNMRDRVGKNAQASTTAALSGWHGTAPYRTGAMRAAPRMALGKGVSHLEVPSGKEFYKINSVNKYGKHAGFYDKFKRQYGRAFFRSATK